MKHLDSKLPESRRKLLQAAWATPVVAAISIPKHAQATTAEVTPEPIATPMPTTTIDCTDPTAANIAANRQGVVVFDPQPLSANSYTYPVESMGTVFTGGTLSIPATDGSILPAEIGGSQEIANVMGRLIVDDLPCDNPDQLAEICITSIHEVVEASNGTTNSVFNGITLHGTSVGGIPDGFSIIPSFTSGTVTNNLCNTYTAAELAAGVFISFAAQTHQFGYSTSWNITGSYTVTWM